MQYTYWYPYSVNTSVMSLLLFCIYSSAAFVINISRVKPFAAARIFNLVCSASLTLIVKRLIYYTLVSVYTVTLSSTNCCDIMLSNSFL